jgi:branched-chain amino acid transport system substrate-binding protein
MSDLVDALGRRLRMVSALRARASLLSALAILALGVAACSSGAGQATKTPTSATTGGVSASKDPITIGVINQSVGSAGAYPDYLQGIEDAVDWINTQLGGVGGRPIKLQTCITDGTPASTTTCAQQFVSSDPLFVTVGIDANMANAYPLLEQAGIPVIGGTAQTPQDYSAKDAYFLTPASPVEVPAAAVFVHQYLPKVKRLGIVVPDVAPAIQALDEALVPLHKFGIKTTVVTVPLDETNYLAAFESIHPNSQDAIMAFLTQTACVALPEAMAEENSKLPVITPSFNCYTPSVLNQVGKEMLGWYIGSQFPQSPLGSTPDAILFQKAVKMFGGNVADSGLEDMFSSMMTIYQGVLKPLGASDMTRHTILAQARSAKGGAIFLGGHYQCGLDSKLPTLCAWDQGMNKVGPGPEYDLISATDNKLIDVLPYVTP